MGSIWDLEGHGSRVTVENQVDKKTKMKWTRGLYEL